jgi:NADH-quinone oxidoreductase subunit C/D
VRIEEMRQSCASSSSASSNMPAGPYKADHPLTTPPPKERTLQDIETLITHFLSVSWGPVMPAGESSPADRGDQGHQQLLPDQ